jgi:thioredoxin reductase (NADPH)
MDRLDCLIIGGGVAGLTASVYLARYRRNIAVFDGGKSRATLIPRTHNCPGFPEGVEGPELIGRLLKQASSYGVTPVAANIDQLTKVNEGFVARYADGEMFASSVLIATGLSDKEPALPRHDQAVADGLVRYCPICDGYEATGMRIAVVGNGKDAFAKAKFLRTYSGSVTLISDALTPEDVAMSDLKAAGIDHRGGLRKLERDGQRVVALLADDARLQFDCIYPSLGCHTGAWLAEGLGARITDAGCLLVDQYQCTNISGLYAAGDVVSDLHQIAVAMGHAAIAATHIHKCLPPNPAPLA